MAELPEGGQLHPAARIRGIAEIVASVQRSAGIICGCPGGKYELWNLSIVPQDRKALRIKGHGHYDRRPPQGSAVLKHKSIPVSLRGIHHTALGDTVIAIAHIVIENILSSERTRQGICQEAVLRLQIFAAGRHVAGKQIVFSIALIQMGPLISQPLAQLILNNDTVQPAGPCPPGFRFQLRDTQCGIPMDDINPVIVIKKQGGIIEKSAHFHPPPRPRRVLGQKQQGFVGIVAGKRQIECLLVEAQRWGPHTQPVDLLPVLQAVGRIVLQSGEDMSNKFPVNQITGAKNVPARHEIHSGADHVVGFSDPDYIRVRKVRVDNWVFIALHGGSPNLFLM